MRHKLGIGTAMGATALATAALVMAPTATAVTPTTATLTADCGIYGKGLAKLEATQNGTAASITLSSSAVKSPIAIAANSLTSTLTLTKNTTGTTTFTGKSNPAIPAQGDVTTGPLAGTVAAGDKLVAKSLKIQYSIITINCTAVTVQSPGPFVF